MSKEFQNFLDECGISREHTALIHVLNRCPTSAVEEKTPHEVWYKEKPGVGHLRVWGCLAYVHIQKDKHAKLGLHMEKCVFIAVLYSPWVIPYGLHRVHMG